MYINQDVTEVLLRCLFHILLFCIWGATTIIIRSYITPPVHYRTLHHVFIIGHLTVWSGLIISGHVRRRAVDDVSGVVQLVSVSVDGSLCGPPVNLLMWCVDGRLYSIELIIAHYCMNVQ